MRRNRYLLFADPRTPEDVQECMRSVRAESPKARRQALDDAVVAVMIEKASAPENLEALRDLLGAG
ncbi:MAG TPA: hypothetical protein VJX92_10300 [Methylomirabilota bacterium]|nr:hypothetical protein [Methylomirabilota bacterium]